MRRSTPLLLIVAMVAACMSSGAPSETPGPTSTASPDGATDGPGPSASTATASDIADGPPDARVQAEGGDPVIGQLGTYTWGDGGSDSPWLPGAAISVGAGEPLSVRFDPPVEVASWRARFVPSSADGPAGATSLGDGVGEPSFAAPFAGSWTVEVNVTFAAERGAASYFWRLDVS